MNKPTHVKGAAESQQSVYLWSLATFGQPVAMRLAVRVLQELTELMQLLATQSDVNRIPKLIEECADIQITLYNLAGCLGCDLQEAVDLKMAINRQRRWFVDEAGCGQHIPETPAMPETPEESTLKGKQTK